jgi:hypothetical protein
VLFVVLACSAATGGACGSYRPPFTQAPSASLPADGQATLVFLWPLSSCDPGGYYTLATTDGRFVGNVAPGAQLRAKVAAGHVTVVGWNELEEVDRGAVSTGAVSVLRANLSAGRTYYVRMASGEWEDEGPRQITRGRFGAGTRCIFPGSRMTSAMVAVTPTSADWKQLAERMAELEPMVPDAPAGQAWLDANRDVLEYHRAVAQARYAGLRPDAKRMATIDAEDGVTASR